MHALTTPDVCFAVVGRIGEDREIQCSSCRNGREKNKPQTTKLQNQHLSEKSASPWKYCPFICSKFSRPFFGVSGKGDNVWVWMWATNAEQASIFEGYVILDYSFLKPVMNLFSQSNKLESLDSESKIRFSCEVMGQGLEGPAGTEIWDEYFVCQKDGCLIQRSNKKSYFLKRKAAFFFQSNLNDTMIFVDSESWLCWQSFFVC